MADAPLTPELPDFLARTQELLAAMEVVEPPTRGRPMARPRRVNWDQLAREAGVVTRRFPGGGSTMTSTGSREAARALEVLLGRDNIRRAVGLLVSVGGSPDARAIAGSVLAFMRSREATEMAYGAYKSARGDDAAEAVGLIKDIAHPRALEWVEEFLADPRVASVGIGVLDEILLRGQADPDGAEVQRLLASAEAHPDEHVRERAASIRDYIRLLNTTGAAVEGR